MALGRCSEGCTDPGSTPSHADPVHPAEVHASIQPPSFGPPTEWKQSSGTGVCPTVCANAGVAAMLCTTGATHAVATPVNAARRRNARRLKAFGSCSGRSCSGMPFIPFSLSVLGDVRWVVRVVQDSQGVQLGDEARELLVQLRRLEVELLRDFLDELLEARLPVRQLPEERRRRVEMVDELGSRGRTARCRRPCPAPGRRPASRACSPSPPRGSRPRRHLTVGRSRIESSRGLRQLPSAEHRIFRTEGPRPNFPFPPRCSRSRGPGRGTRGHTPERVPDQPVHRRMTRCPDGGPTRGGYRGRRQACGLRGAPGGGERPARGPRGGLAPSARISCATAHHRSRRGRGPRGHPGGDGAAAHRARRAPPGGDGHGAPPRPSARGALLGDG